MTACPLQRPVLSADAMKEAKAKRQKVLAAVRARRGMVYRRVLAQRRAALTSRSSGSGGL